MELAETLNILKTHPFQIKKIGEYRNNTIYFVDYGDAPIQFKRFKQKYIHFGDGVILMLTVNNEYYKYVEYEKGIIGLTQRTKNTIDLQLLKRHNLESRPFNKNASIMRNAIQHNLFEDAENPLPELLGNGNWGEELFFSNFKIYKFYMSKEVDIPVDIKINTPRTKVLIYSRYGLGFRLELVDGKFRIKEIGIIDVNALNLDDGMPIKESRLLLDIKTDVFPFKPRLTNNKLVMTYQKKFEMALVFTSNDQTIRPLPYGRVYIVYPEDVDNIRGFLDSHFQMHKGVMRKKTSFFKMDIFKRLIDIDLTLGDNALFVTSLLKKG